VSVRATTRRHGIAPAHHSATPDHVVVVGAGLAGLSSAMHLAGAGRRVTVLEAESAPGGRAARVSLPATGGGTYHLDTGPTVLTMPDLLADCFAALGEQLSDWVTLQPLDPAYRAQFADGTALSVTNDVAEMAERIRIFSGSNGSRDADGYRRYVGLVTRLYRLQMRDFIDRNFDSPVDLVGSSLAKLVALRGFSRLAPTVARYFRDERLQRVFSFQAMYAGVSPTRTVPASGRSNPAIRRSIVVFPQPLGPSSEQISPRSTARSTPATAAVDPNDLESDWQWIAVICPNRRLT